MKYEAHVDGVRKLVQLELTDGVVQASIDDRPYRIRLVQPEQGVYLLFIGSQVYEARASSLEGNLISVTLGGRTFSCRFDDRKHRRPAVDVAPHGQQYLTAPMPGKVVRVLLSSGEMVAAGQGVVVVEAMKMQNEVKSPKSGQLVEIRVKEGDTVTANQILATVE